MRGVSEPLTQNSHGWRSCGWVHTSARTRASPGTSATAVPPLPGRGAQALGAMGLARVREFGPGVTVASNTTFPPSLSQPSYAHAWLCHTCLPNSLAPIWPCSSAQPHWDQATSPPLTPLRLGWPPPHCPACQIRPMGWIRPVSRLRLYLWPTSEKGWAPQLWHPDVASRHLHTWSVDWGGGEMFPIYHFLEMFVFCSFLDFDYSYMKSNG